LKNGPLLRALLVRIDDEQFRLYMTVHQIIFDAVTAYRVFLPELATLYQAFMADKPRHCRNFPFSMRTLPTGSEKGRQITLGPNT